MDITIALGIIIVFLLIVIICYLLVLLEIMNEKDQILKVRKKLKKLIQKINTDMKNNLPENKKIENTKITNTKIKNG